MFNFYQEHVFYIKWIWSCHVISPSSVFCLIANPLTGSIDKDILCSWRTKFTYYITKKSSTFIFNKNVCSSYLAFPIPFSLFTLKHTKNQYKPTKRKPQASIIISPWHLCRTESRFGTKWKIKIPKPITKT